MLGAALGWHQGNYQGTLGALVNAPVGFWRRGNLANIGFNRWAIDLNGALTYLDVTTGLELSGAAGFTFNFEKPDTHYKTGTEFHVSGGDAKLVEDLRYRHCWLLLSPDFWRQR